MILGALNILARIRLFGTIPTANCYDAGKLSPQKSFGAGSKPICAEALGHQKLPSKLVDTTEGNSNIAPRDAGMVIIVLVKQSIDHLQPTQK